jgi:hypothetical protein
MNNSLKRKKTKKNGDNQNDVDETLDGTHRIHIIYKTLHDKVLIGLKSHPTKYSAWILFLPITVASE